MPCNLSFWKKDGFEVELFSGYYTLAYYRLESNDVIYFIIPIYYTELQVYSILI